MEQGEFINAKQLNAMIIKSLNVPADYPELKSISILVMSHLFQLNHMDLILNKKIQFNSKNNAVLQGIIKRINMQEPVQYVLGIAHFYGLEINVEPGVLIPRPETEELVDVIIKENLQPGLNILDIGTGSGCIAIALEKNLPSAKLTAMDVSADAIKIATENAKKNLSHIQFLQADIFTELSQLPEFDIIVSNPPYVLDHEKLGMKKNVVEHEPHLALFVADRNPLIFYERIIEITQKLLRKGGKLYFEINEKFGREVEGLMFNNGFSDSMVLKDMQNKDRIVKGTKS
ncbi:MAG: peptide chain release factor N(5)-glutamine methyltransferase [Bacteroidota bacterium]|nr:peptide chain release factor N(5)-glutamine methyltransferase [Bacteroidota bacterium]